MSWMNSIISWLKDIESSFYDAYLEVYYWIYPFWLLAYPLLYISRGFGWLAYYFSFLNNWLVWAADEIDKILSTTDIWSYFKWWFNAAENAWSWVYDAVKNVKAIIESWWSSKYQDILALIEGAKGWSKALIDSVASQLSSLTTRWDSFTSSILPNLADWTGVEELIATATSDLLPLIEGWQEFKEAIVSFFSDPLQWLYNRLDEFFERFW